MTIHILFLEDAPADAELAEQALRASGLDFTARRAATRAEFEFGLREFQPDVVITDHNLPQFTGAEALRLTRDLAPGVPVILLTGSVGEETAVEYMRAGAADYILKDRLARLGSAVTRALESCRMEREMREREAYFRALIEQALDVITVLDGAGAIRYASPSVQRILGYTAPEITGRSMIDLLHPDDRASTARVFAEGVATGQGGRFLELRVRHKDGSYRTIEAVGRYLLNDPVVRGAIIAARDVTERRSLERQLLQAQKMEAVGRLAGGVAHDFNNILTAILGYAGLLLEGLPTLSPLRADIDEIRKAADRAANLTRQLLAFSRKQVLDIRVIDVNALVADMDRLLRRLLGEDIEISAHLDSTLGTVRADAGQLEQVLVNLAVNARDAMPEGGQLTIETRNVDLDTTYATEHLPVEPGPYVLLAVTDTGTGMSPEIMSHIFEPFFTTKNPGKGTGLGLATVYGVVKQLKGYVWCYSEFGQGTSFKVYLPRVSEAPDGPRSRPNLRPMRGSETVLLVEDDQRLRALTRRILEKYGYVVLEADCAPAALKLVGTHPGRIHMVLTDVVLPGPSGPALAAELTVRWPGLRVLYMSGYTEDAIIHRGVLGPNTAFLHKPFTAESLAAKVRDVLDGPYQAVRRDV